MTPSLCVTQVMIGNAHYQCSCVRYMPISVDSMRPLYGPVAGGTRVTITGHFANASAVKSVFFGTRKSIIDKQRLVLIQASCERMGPLCRSATYQVTDPEP